MFAVVMLCRRRNCGEAVEGADGRELQGRELQSDETANTTTRRNGLEYYSDAGDGANTAALLCLACRMLACVMLACVMQRLQRSILPAKLVPINAGENDGCEAECDGDSLQACAALCTLLILSPSTAKSPDRGSTWIMGSTNC
jgi:hypothetical protein